MIHVRLYTKSWNYKPKVYRIAISKDTNTWLPSTTGNCKEYWKLKKQGLAVILYVKETYQTFYYLQELQNTLSKL